MKRALTILLATALLFSLAACRREPPEPVPPEETTEDATPKLPALADVLANWAWAVSNGSGEEAATQLAVIAYAIDADFTKLDLAVGPFGQAKVKYMGEKQGDGNGEWFAVFDNITGPYFAFEQPVPVHGQTAPLLLVDSGALGNGLVLLEHQYDRETFVYPPASDADISRAEVSQAGRKVVESQLLATAEDGARICLFLYESLEEEELFACAYIEEGGVFLSYNTPIESGNAPWWHGEPDSIGLLMLCRTQEAIAINIAWNAPEGDATMFSLCEFEGALEPFGLPSYGYDPWSDAFYPSGAEASEEDEETP